MSDEILNKIENKLLNYSIIISFQKEEILKSEKLIDEFKNHLSKQNEALKMFLSEEDKLIELKNKRLLQMNLENVIVIEDEPAQINENNVSPNNVAQKNILPLSNYFSYLKENQIKILEIRNKIVYTIQECNETYIVGGSKGMLMRSDHETTHVYQTDTQEDIVQLAVISNGVRAALLAFTKDTIMIFENIDNYTIRRNETLPHIGCVHNDGQWIYIPLKGGLIKRISNENLSIENFLDLKEGDINSFVVGRSDNSPSLYSDTDDNLYKVTFTKKPTFKIEELDRFKNIKKVLRIMSDYFLFYSSDMIYVVSQNLQNCGTLTFDNGIKFVDVYYDFFGVVDWDDILYIYKVTKFGSIHGKVLTERLVGKITALSMSEEALVCIGNDIFKIVYKI